MSSIRLFMDTTAWRMSTWRCPHTRYLYVVLDKSSIVRRIGGILWQAKSWQMLSMTAWLLPWADWPAMQPETYSVDSSSLFIRKKLRRRRKEK